MPAVRDADVEVEILDRADYQRRRARGLLHSSKGHKPTRFFLDVTARGSEITQAAVTCDGPMELCAEIWERVMQTEDP